MLIYLIRYEVINLETDNLYLKSVIKEEKGNNALDIFLEIVKVSEDAISIEYLFNIVYEKNQ